MAVTITKEQLHRIPLQSGGALILGIFLVQFDATYPTGGEEVDLSGYMKQVIDMKVQSTEDFPGCVFDVDDSNFATAKPKVEAYRIGLAASAVVAGADNTIVKKADGAPLEVSGAGVAFQSPLSEVANGTDLSAVKVRCIVWGLG